MGKSFGWGREMETYGGNSDTEVSVSALPVLPRLPKLLTVLAVDAVVETDARLRDLEAGCPNDDVEVELAAVLRDESSLGDAGQRVGDEVHVVALQRSEPSSVVCRNGSARRDAEVKKKERTGNTLAVHRVGGNERSPVLLRELRLHVGNDVLGHALAESCCPGAGSSREDVAVVLVEDLPAVETERSRHPSEDELLKGRVCERGVVSTRLRELGGKVDAQLKLTLGRK